jgi:hypothetical protein
MHILKSQKHLTKVQSPNDYAFSKVKLNVLPTSIVLRT